MRVVFVGIHNKPGLKPLDSKTKSGKLIDKCIAGLPKTVDYLKANLWNVDYLPTDPDPWKSVSNLIQRIDYNPDKDIIVALGGTVQDILKKTNIKYVIMGHPSMVWSNANQLEYVERLMSRLQADSKESDLRAK